MTGPSKSYSFRLKKPFSARLEHESEKRGVSPHDYARQMVIAGLSHPNEELLSEVAEVRRELQSLRHQFVQGHRHLAEQKDELARMIQSAVASPGGEPESLAPVLSEVSEHITQLREDYATGLIALLVHSCKWELEYAVKWVQEKILDREEE